MKKFLYCAAVVALATACTQEDDFLTVPSSQAQEQGLVLNATLANTDATTKGELYEDNKTYPFFWYAEQDRIDVVGLNLKGAITSGTGTNAEVVGFGTNTAGKGVATLGTAGAWTLPTVSGFASYKATQSQGEGKFTAASDNDMLTLTTIESTDDAATVASKTATIIATYDGVEVAAATSQLNPLTSQAVPGSLTSLVLKTKESNATQNIDRPNQVDAPMWSVSSASRTDDYSSVGEKVDLQLKRPFPVLRFTTTGVDKFAKDFGPLQSVELKTIGKNADGKWDSDEEGSALVYAADKNYGVIGTAQGWIKDHTGKWEAETNWAETTDPNKVTVNIASTDDWSDANSVYMTVAPVDRSKMTDGEMLVVTYNFENITFTLNGSLEGAKDFEKLISKNSWTAFTADGRPNAVTKITPLDINNYNYLVVKNGSSNYTLIVNKGKVGDVLNAAKTNVVWGSINPVLSTIKKIVVNCDIEDADFANLNLFKNVTELELAEETSIPAKGLASFAGVTTLTMLKVTTIDEDFLGELGTEQFTGLTNLNMAAYNFPTTVINDKFFNAQTKISLKVLNMSGIDDMTAAWPLTRTINFDGYALTEVTVKDGVQLSPNAFANCAALATVNGKVTLMDNASATGAFFGAKVLKTINVTNSKVPANAFKKAELLENILVDGKQIVPTVVGESAFESTSALEYMDLSKVTTMGKYAFKNSGLKATSKDNNIIEVGISIAENEIFRNSNVEYVYFPNVTKVNGNLFQSMKTLKQVKFGKEFTVAAVQAWTEPFGLTPELVDLFLVESMRGGDYWAEGSNNLVLPTVTIDGKAGTPATIGFRVIKVDDGSFGN